MIKYRSASNIQYASIAVYRQEFMSTFCCWFSIWFWLFEINNTVFLLFIGNGIYVKLYVNKAIYQKLCIICETVRYNTHMAYILCLQYVQTIYTIHISYFLTFWIVWNLRNYVNWSNICNYNDTRACYNIYCLTIPPRFYMRICRINIKLSYSSTYAISQCSWSYRFK